MHPDLGAPALLPDETPDGGVEGLGVPVVGVGAGRLGVDPRDRYRGLRGAGRRPRASERAMLRASSSPVSSYPASSAPSGRSGPLVRHVAPCRSDRDAGAVEQVRDVGRHRGGHEDLLRAGHHLCQA